METPCPGHKSPLTESDSSSPSIRLTKTNSKWEESFLHFKHTIYTDIISVFHVCQKKVSTQFFSLHSSSHIAYL